MKHLNVIATYLLTISMLFLATISMANAAVYISGTRIIYPADQKEITVNISNKGKSPALMQLWVDRGNPQSQYQHADAPFLITPPIFRLEPNKGQRIRLAFTGESLPQDRESLFWFNALEIPPTSANDTKSNMQVAIRSRLKLFYRPAGLIGDPVSAVKQVTWKVAPAPDGKGYVLQGNNPSPYHVTYSKLTLVINKKTYELGSAMINPHGAHHINIKNLHQKTGRSELIYRAMGDYSVGVEQKVVVD